MFGSTLTTNLLQFNLTPVESEIASPVDGSLLSESEQTFTLTRGVGVKYKWIYFGTSKGQNDIEAKFISNDELEHTFDLQSNSKEIYVRLWSYINNSWTFNDYEYSIKQSEPANNLTENFSFEEGDIFPGGWKFSASQGNSVEWDDSVKRGGSKSIKLINNNSGRVRAISSRWNELDKVVRTLTISGYTRQSDFNGGFHTLSLRVLFADGSIQFKHIKYAVKNNIWQYRSETFNFSKDVESFMVFCQLNKTTGTVWFDDISVVNSDNEVLHNGGFEKENPPDFWRYSLSSGNGAFWDRNNSYTGEKSVKLVNTNKRVARFIMMGECKFVNPTRSHIIIWC